MKLLIFEGGDRLGKSTLIKSLFNYFENQNIMIRHFGKPPKKDLTPEEVIHFQFECFEQEAHLHNLLDDKNKRKYNYYDDILIWNRSHLGEYVYGPMFRKENSEVIKILLVLYEKFKLKCLTNKDIYLITLTASPKFFLSKEDGNSFSKNLKEKSKELELFKEVHKLSLIKNKLLLKVDKNGQFRDKKEIFNEVLTFINK